jgi:hypothetical protein
MGKFVRVKLAFTPDITRQPRIQYYHVLSLRLSSAYGILHLCLRYGSERSENRLSGFGILCNISVIA